MIDKKATIEEITEQAIEQYKEKPFQTAMNLIRRNSKFKELNIHIQKILIWLSAFYLINYDDCEECEEGVIFDGILLTHNDIYDFLITADEEILEIVMENSSLGFKAENLKNISTKNI